MWYYMITCYLMSFVTFAMMVTGFFQSFLKFSIFRANHVTFMVLTCIVYCFTETLVIFFFVGTGMGIKESAAAHREGALFHQRSIAVKRKVFPPLLFNMLLMMVLFVLVGAVDTHRFPSWAYTLLFLGCLFHFVKTKAVQNQSFGDITKIAFELSGAK